MKCDTMMFAEEMNLSEARGSTVMATILVPGRIQRQRRPDALPFPEERDMWRDDMEDITNCFRTSKVSELAAQPCRPADSADSSTILKVLRHLANVPAAAVYGMHCLLVGMKTAVSPLWIGRTAVEVIDTWRTQSR